MERANKESVVAARDFIQAGKIVSIRLQFGTASTVQISNSSGGHFYPTP